MTCQYILLPKLFWGYDWDMTLSCSCKRCRKYSNFVRFLSLLKRTVLKNMIFVFLLLDRYKRNYNSRTITGWRHTINFVLNTLKTGKNVLFSSLLLKSTLIWASPHLSKLINNFLNKTYKWLKCNIKFCT